jgi:hypothetical protein
MNKLLVIITAMAFLTACNNENKVDEKVPEESYQEGEIVNAQATLVQQSFPDLFAYIDKQDSSFTPDHFSLNGENKIDSLPAVPLEQDQLQPFKSMLIYNSDSTLAVDLFSYNYIITQRNGKKSMEEAGPDTEVGLVDVKANTRKRIFFSGPAAAVYDAKWINNKELLLAGSETVENNQIKPTVWQVSLADSVMQTFTYTSPVNADMKAYVQNKTAQLQQP